MRLKPSGAAAVRPTEVLAGLTLLAILACARMGSPPGGPEDKVPPKLLGTVPESLGVYGNWNRDVEFRFDKVVSEGSSPNYGLGTGDLERLFLVSPSGSVPVVHWKRDRITVRPKEGWKPNRAYRIELLPGITDLRRNKLDTTAVLTFSTGGVMPTDTLRGLVVDWVSGRVARQALVELTLMPDSLTYRTVADSGGRFVIGPLPHGAWSVVGVLDQNHNLRRDRRENYDSLQVPASTFNIGALWLIPRDSLGPKITSVTPIDSVSATINFSQPLDPTQRFDSLGISFRLQKDSTEVPIRSLRPPALDDSLQKIARALADSLKALQDTTKRDTTSQKPAGPPKLPQASRPGSPRTGTAPAKVDAEADSIIKTRPALFERLILRVDSAFVPLSKFDLQIRGIRSAAGVSADAKSILVIPKPKPAPKPQATDSTGALADSVKVRAPADSTKLVTPADSTKKP
jgi:hypothetical protein